MLEIKITSSTAGLLPFYNPADTDPHEFQATINDQVVYAMLTAQDTTSSTGINEYPAF